MDHAGSQLPWSEEQWTKVQSAVTEAFTRASVAGQFLPCFEPEQVGADSIRADQLRIDVARAGAPSNPIGVRGQRSLEFFTITVRAELSNQQISEKSLSTAMFVFKRAAALLAQGEDFIVFSGFETPIGGVNIGSTRTVPAGVEVTGGLRTAWGLIEYGELSAIRALPFGKASPGTRGIAVAAGGGGAVTGDDISNQVTSAIGQLEADGYPGPYACVLDNQLFDLVYRPSTPRGELPADRIRAVLAGPLLRSGQVLARHGVVISLASEVVDLAIASPPKVQFLQVTADARYLFRVFERFVLRIKESGRGSGNLRASAFTFNA